LGFNGLVWSGILADIRSLGVATMKARLAVASTLLAGAVLLALAPLSQAQPARGAFIDKPTQEQISFFEKKIRPVLIEHCYECHSADAKKVKGDYLLDTRDAMRKGGNAGPPITPGSPEKSKLIASLKHKNKDTAMPPKGKLPDSVIADFETWVKMGAPDPRDGTAAALPKKYEIDLVKGREFWAFKAPKKSDPPKAKGAESPIDAFILAKLDEKGLKQADLADKRTLIRRVYLDLTGLPPTGDEVEAFLADRDANAYEKVVDRLLASPHFGERWGRHWLDIARYAESSGKTVNMNYPHAWRYRDYVIAAFNKDKPYDQFVKEQLAGDLMTTSDPKLKAERLIATGFLAIGAKTLNENNGTQFELDVADEQIDVTTQAFLGITAACARCHDHKFDPIPQKDYYALAGIFRSTETCYGTVRFIQSNRPSPTIALPKDCGFSAGTTDTLTAAEKTRIEKQIEDLNKRISEETDFIRTIFPRGQVSLLRARLDAFDSNGDPKLLAMGVRDKPAGKGGFGGPPKGGPGMGGFGGRGGSNTIADSPAYDRGEPDKPSRDRVPRGTLQVMSKTPLTITRGQSGRLDLANWIASKDNPLTARVMVNRVWLHLFGRGLVPTADNFGAAGHAPSHPELLDYLAVSFADEHKWSVKKLIKSVVMSRAYRLDSKNDKKNFEVDPDNAFVWRMSPRRLDAEAMRDSMLAVSGQLNEKPPVGSAVSRAGEGPAGGRFGAGGGPGGAAAGNDPRNANRSVYLPIVRDNLPEALALFDAPDPSLIAADRPTTTVPAQGLFLLNNPFVIRASEAAADKIMKGTTTDTERIRQAYLTFYGRPPNEKELQNAEKFLAAYQAQLAKDRVPQLRRERETWAAFAQALFASAEFQYRK
jgi:cytochrome c553